jgi:hypothetical protein
VARTYAGILGPLALVISLARGLLGGGSTDSVLWAGWWNLLVFTAVGGVIGWLAERIVADAVQGRIAAELAARPAGPAPPGKAAAAG